VSLGGRPVDRLVGHPCYTRNLQNSGKKFYIEVFITIGVMCVVFDKRNCSGLFSFGSQQDSTLSQKVMKTCRMNYVATEKQSTLSSAKVF